MSKYFKEIEANMDKRFLFVLDEAREFAGIPFIINSAYRSPDHPESIKNPTSSHIKGLAVDIKVTDSVTRFKIIEALVSVGFTRIGIADTFIHVDLDLDKTQNVIWTY
jgi:uncharacterized protein YcbK (DUF882 family)